MSIFSGWLKNANGDYVAPKTKTELVLCDDGTTLKDSLAQYSSPTLIASNVAHSSIVTVPSEYTRVCLLVKNPNSVVAYVEIPKAFIVSDTLFSANDTKRFWFQKQSDTTFKFQASDTAYVVTVYGIK